MKGGGRPARLMERDDGLSLVRLPQEGALSVDFCALLQRGEKRDVCKGGGEPLQVEAE